MKFEDPKMNISMFEVENVVTESNPTTNKAVDAAKAAINGQSSSVPTAFEILEVNFN